MYPLQDLAVLEALVASMELSSTMLAEWVQQEAEI
jgi:hypothetical protein